MRHQTERDKPKGWPRHVSGGGEGWAGPGPGQQPLPGFLTVLLFEALLGHPGNGRHHSQQRRGSCLNVSAPPHTLAQGLEMGVQPRLPDPSTWPSCPTPTLMSGLLTLLSGGAKSKPLATDLAADLPALGGIPRAPQIPVFPRASSLSCPGGWNLTPIMPLG